MKRIIISISTIIVFISLMALYLYGLNFGVDLKGGALLEITSLNSIEEIRAVLGYDVSVQAIENTSDFIIAGNDLKSIKEGLKNLNLLISILELH